MSEYGFGHHHRRQCPYCTMYLWVAKDGTLHKTEERASMHEQDLIDDFEHEYPKGDDPSGESSRTDWFEHEHPDERERRYSEYE